MEKRLYNKFMELYNKVGKETDPMQKHCATVACERARMEYLMYVRKKYNRGDV